MPRCIGRLLTAMLLLAMPWVALGAEQESQRPRGYRFDTEVLLIPVSVFVTDAEGSPVKGLKAEDFVIEEEGKARPVELFQEVDSARLSTAASGLTPEALPPGMRRQFLLLFDLSFSSPRGLLRAQQAALRFVEEQLAETDLVAVATYSSVGGLKVLTNFTPDRVPARHMIAGLGLLRTTDLIQDQIGFLFDTRPATGLGAVPQGVDGPMEQQVLEQLESLGARQQRSDDDAYRSHAAQYFGQFAALASSLRALSGRKYILLFSEGVDSRFLTGTGITEIDSDLQKFIDGNVEAINTDNRFGRLELREVLMDGLEMAAAGDTVIHAFDVSGLGGEAGGHPGTGEGRGQDTLYIMADETGGELFKNLNDLRQPLQKILDASSSFYLLGFTPIDLKRQGRFRKIDVQVNRPGVRVTHRRGYYEPSPPDKMTDVERKLQIAEYVTKNLLSDDVYFETLAATFPGQGPLARVPIFLKFPGKQFFETGRRSDVLQIEVYGYAIDGQGRFLDHFNKVLAFDLKKDRSSLEKNGFKYYDLLFANPGPVRLKLLARDVETGWIGSFIEDIEVPDFSKGELALSPPVFATAEPGWIVTRGFDPASPEPRREGLPIGYPFRAEGQEFIPAVRPLVNAAEPAHFAVLACNLKLHPVTRQPQTEMKFERVGADGEIQVLGSVGLLTRPEQPAPNCFQLLFQIQWKDVAAGPALLRMSLTDTIAKKTVSGASAYVLEP